MLANLVLHKLLAIKNLKPSVVCSSIVVMFINTNTRVVFVTFINAYFTQTHKTIVVPV